MKSTTRLSRALRGTAIALFLAGVGAWFATGAHFGWTQTTAVTLHRDEVTDIEYPVRRAVFVAGIEVPLLAALVAAGFAGLTLIPRRTTSTV